MLVNAKLAILMLSLDIEHFPHEVERRRTVLSSFTRTQRLAIQEFTGYVYEIDEEKSLSI
jgi:hypothetical protein